ncbi:MAG: AAA family ATPase [Gemmataceae bacterium]
MNAAASLPSCQDFQPLRPGQLAERVPASLSWLWHGYLAPGKITVLISPPKSGKTTLLSILLARSLQGGQLAGLPVAPARCLVVSEESANDWAARCRRLAIGDNVQFLCRSFRGAHPTDALWLSLIASLEARHRQEPLDLVVIDPLATLLPSYAESCAPKLIDCLLPLQDLANRGPAIWLLHHLAKGKRSDGQAGRGPSTLPGFVDIVMEMSPCRPARSRDRRRRIWAYSRYEETPRHLILELNPEANDYLVRTDATGTPLAKNWQEIHWILVASSHKLTQERILQELTSLHDNNPPDRTTVVRWLKRAAQQGQICRGGSGYRHDPFLYWLPGREPLLYPGHKATEEEKDAWRERLAAHKRAQQQASPSSAPP